MNPLRFVVDAFVNTFGITKPSERQQQMAGWFIAGMLLLVILGLALVGWVLKSALLR